MTVANDFFGIPPPSFSLILSLFHCHSGRSMGRLRPARTELIDFASFFCLRASFFIFVRSNSLFTPCKRFMIFMFSARSLSSARRRLMV